MKRQWFCSILLPLAGMCLLASAGCSAGKADADASASGSEQVAVSLSLSLEGSSSALTKADGALTELANTDGSTNNFRGMKNIRILSFPVKRKVRAGDFSIAHMRHLPDISSSVDEAAFSGNVFHGGLIRNNRAHIYPDAYAAMPVGTASVLLYGSGPRVGLTDVQQEKHLYGSLVEEGLGEMEDSRDAGSITFSPDPIYTGEIPETATRLANLMTEIAQGVSYTQTYWFKRNGVWEQGSYAVRWDNDLADMTLREYYRWFTGGGELMTGAGVSVEYLLSHLYGRLSRYESDDADLYYHVAGGVQYQTVLTEAGTDTFTYAVLYNGLCNEILRRFHDLEDRGLIIVHSDDTVTFNSERNPDLYAYPVSMGLPAGSAVLRWNGLRFVVVSEGLDGIAAMDNYCYMPPLYYFANTQLSTSGDNDIYKTYTSEMTDWSQLLGQYRQGSVVRASTRAVALNEPLQFATGLLVATVRASSPYLPDGDDDPRTNCSVSGTHFPITGILLGGQYKQSFDFTPDTSGSEYYLYDNMISGVYLTATQSAPFRTLVLPTPEDQDIYFFLELRNDSGATFTGAEGLILPGNYFYLAGKLEKSDNPDFPQVFMQDHYTSVNCQVSSLENAHVAVPEMGTAQLVVGVQTATNWTMAASSYVVLD